MTTGTAAQILLPDVCNEIELAYQGKNGFGGDVAEIYAYRLIPRHHPGMASGPPGIDAMDALEAASNLTKLCQAFLVMHPDARFAIEKHEPRLFEDVDVNDWTGAGPPIPPFSHRIHLKVYPAPVDDPKVCVTLTWKVGTIGSKFRVIIDGTYTTVEVQREDRLGAPSWRVHDSQRGISEEKIIGAALGAIVRGESHGPIERIYRDGVIFIDIPGVFEVED